MSNISNQRVEKPKIFTILKIVAPILLVLGITLIVLSCTVLGDKEVFMGETEIWPNVACLIPGILVTFIGFLGSVFAFIPQINKTIVQTEKYLQQENKDDLTDIASTKAEIYGGAVTTTTKAIKEGWTDGQTNSLPIDDDGDPQKFCKHCGQMIDADSTFCTHCGGKQ